MLRDFLTYLPSNLLVKIDRASMANSLEVRSPYLDPSLVKFIWSLPDEYLNYNNVDKSILRDILAENFSKNSCVHTARFSLFENLPPERFIYSLAGTS